MFRRLTTALALALAGLSTLADVPQASAHPAPYPHRHYYRGEAPRPVRRARMPRRPVEQPRVESYDRHMYLGLGFLGTSVNGGDDTSLTSVIGDGGGFDLTLGFRLNRYAALDLGWMSSFHDNGPSGDFHSGMLSALTFDVKVFLLPDAQRLEPYAQVGVGAYGLTGGNIASDALNGGGFQAGGGLDIRLNPAVSIGGRALFRGAYMDNSDANFGFAPTEEAFLNMFTLGADLKLHF